MDHSITACNRPAVPDTVAELRYLSVADNAEDWALVWPGIKSQWVVMLHGHGSTGDQLYTRADIRCWIDVFREHGGGILTPNLRGNAWMSPAAVNDLEALLGVVRREFGAEKFLFASGSMGATGNLVYAIRRPQDVAGVVALGAATDLAAYWRWCKEPGRSPVVTEIREAIEKAYGGTLEQRLVTFQKHSVCAQADRLTMPVFLAHGETDPTIPVEQARNLAARMCETAGFQYVEITNGGHDAPLTLMQQAFDHVQ